MKAFIFDLYNTLIDIKTDEHCEKAWAPVVGFFAERGIKADWKTLCEEHGKYWKLYLERAVAEREYLFPECDEVAIFESMARGLRGKLTEVDAALACLLMHGSSVIRMKQFDGTVKLLTELKSRGAEIYLLSNAQSFVARSNMKECGLSEELFDGIMISSEAGVRKPDPAFFERLFDEFDIDKTTAVMIGDDKDTDILGANKVGIASVWAGGGAAAHAEEILALADER